MTDDERRAWLRSLKPGDKVQVVHSIGNARIKTVVEDTGRLLVDYVAVESGSPMGEHYSRYTGKTEFPHGLPAWIGDLSYIFPAEYDSQEAIDRLKLRYFCSCIEHRGEGHYLGLPIATVRKLLAVLAEVEETKAE